METESVRKLIDICAEAAHLEHMLPKLPAGLTPRCIRVVDQVASLTRQNETVRVSDISEMLDVTRPTSPRYWVIWTVWVILQRRGIPPTAVWSMYADRKAGRRKC